MTLALWVNQDSIMLNICFIMKESENKQLNRLHLFIRARMDGILFMQERCHYLVIIYRKKTRTHNTFIIRKIYTDMNT